MRGKPNTSWGKSAKWYQKSVTNNDSFQNKVILPNLLRLVNAKKGEGILDLACGEGFFARALAGERARVIGCDIAPELIGLARKNDDKGVEYKICSSDKISFAADNQFNKIICVLALQNIENIQGTLQECRRVLTQDGELFIVLNHPAFRIPKFSSWGWDEGEKVEYRRIDKYLSENRVKIVMHPGLNTDETTISFHRPLQYYFKSLVKAGLTVNGLEEWISHREPGNGPKHDSEDRARKEIPLFLFIKAKK